MRSHRQLVRLTANPRTLTLLLAATVTVAACGGDDGRATPSTLTPTTDDGRATSTLTPTTETPIEGETSAANNIGGGCEVVTVDDATELLGRPARMPERITIGVGPYEDWLVQACHWEVDVPDDVLGAARLEYRLWGNGAPFVQSGNAGAYGDVRPIDVGERGFYAPSGSAVEFALGDRLVDLRVVLADNAASKAALSLSRPSKTVGVFQPPEALIALQEQMEAPLIELARKVEAVLSAGATTSTSTP